MASEDVIELGSSDDESEPAPKKIKPNAMVHIPRKLSGVAIEPVKPSLPSLHKKLSGRSITIKKIENSAAEVKNNRNALRKPVARPIVKSMYKAVTIKQGLNPISLNMSNSQVAINRVPATLVKEPIKVSKFEGISLNSLPSSITVKKTMPPLKHTNIINIRNKLNKNLKILPKVALPPKVTVVPNLVASKSSVGDILTVELDDDDANLEPANTNGPQWYLRPEEQKQREKIEEQNNTEPKSSNFIEITIEDSPVKPINKTHEIGAEFAITIEDSPIKFTAKRKTPINCSDEENKEVHRTPKTKKKLEYPKNSVKTVEIEIEPIELDVGSHAGTSNEVVHADTIENDLELNAQINEKYMPEVPAKITAMEESQPQKSNDVNNGDNEFHPVYQSFIDLCFELENSDDMQKIVDKKIKGYYRQVPKEYRESEEFLDMVSSKIVSMKAGPERMYLYIKDVVDELNFKRKSYKQNAPHTQETIINDKEAEKFFYGDESEFNSKRQRQIRKLEKTLKKLHRAIQKLEEQEVDFDDDEDSVYLLTERYKERMIRVHAKFCQLTNTKMPSEPRVHIEARPGQPSGPAKRLEKMINKKVPIGTPLPFPDFHDVLRCVREANDEDKLCWNEADIMDEARDLFIRCGRKLQRRRQENEWRLAASRISSELDPAADSDELKKKLEQNKLLAIKKETELFNKYADKQNQMKLEAVEIGDKEAEESPVESEDDDVQEDVSLENSEKRKERLKRLLQEKYTKDSEKNEDPSTNDPNGKTKLNDMNQKECTDINMEIEECTNIKIKSVESLSEIINIDDKLQSLSDDSSKINSDMDELHLLQKLHSDNELNNSTQNSSDSDSLIAISDSLDSSSDSKKQLGEDVISIENSSYSEPEVNEVDLIINPTECSIPETVKETGNFEIEHSTTVGTEKKIDKSNNEEYNESVENILLASSDEECDNNKKLSDNKENGYVNLNDDTISIGETIIEVNNSKVDINISNGKEDDTSLKKQSNDISTIETSPNVNVEQKAGSADLQEVDTNDEKIKSSEPVLIENRLNNLKENNITSTIDDDSVNGDISSDADKQNKSNGTHDKQHTECDSVEEVEASATEAMEVVTTSPCDDVNG